MRSVAVFPVLVAVLSLSLAGCGAQAPPFKPVVDTKTLMASVVEKQANIVWESVGEVATLEGVQEIRPQTDEQWQNIRDAAVNITESANLLMISPRAQDNQEWMGAAAGLITQGERMMSASDRRNTKDVFEVGADMYEACVRCHMQYMPGVKESYR
jgi:hypothetical protein